jgi:hypothetical protein
MYARRISGTSAYAITAAFPATPPWSGIAACLLAHNRLVTAVAGKTMRETVGRGQVQDALPEPATEVADAGAWMVASSLAATVDFRGILGNSPAGATVGASPRQAGFAPACGAAA